MEKVTGTVEKTGYSIYALVEELPTEEKRNLQIQMRRTALSLTNNIAEGHGRFHYEENIQFLRQSRGSLEELIDDLITCSESEPTQGRSMLDERNCILLSN